jgi:hypothetical protein
MKSATLQWGANGSNISALANLKQRGAISSHSISEAR